MEEARSSATGEQIIVYLAFGRVIPQIPPGHDEASVITAYQ